MNPKVAFAITMSLAVLPFLIASLLADMNRKALLAALTIGVLGGALYAASSTSQGMMLQHWMSRGVGLNIVLLFCGLAALAMGLQQIKKRRELYVNLRWPATITQAKMEHYGVKFLETNGWSVTNDLGGFAGIRVYRCKKDQLRLLAVFVKNRMPFGSFVQELNRIQGMIIDWVIVIYMEDVTKSIEEAGRKSGFLIVNYSELSRIDELVQCRNREGRTRRNSAKTGAHGGTASSGTPVA